MSLDSDGINKWSKETTPDDILYAKEILNVYSKELNIKAALLVDPDIVDHKEAIKALKKIMK